ncbi:MAG: Epoxyqueuosine reductase, partial [uncultured Lysobacter sp.]
VPGTSSRSAPTSPTSACATTWTVHRLRSCSRGTRTNSFDAPKAPRYAEAAMSVGCATSPSRSEMRRRRTRWWARCAHVARAAAPWWASTSSGRSRGTVQP